MDILRAELKKMRKGPLFELVLNLKISPCLIGARSCGFHLKYKGSSFCVSEMLGKGCQVESLEELEGLYPQKEGVNSLFPFLQEMEAELLLPEKRAAEFKVYHRVYLTRSTFFLGRIIERRRKERGDNLKDLLIKAAIQYSSYVEDSSTIFLLE